MSPLEEEESQAEGREYSYELGNYQMQRIGLDGVLMSPEKEAQWNDIAEYQSALQEALESGKQLDSSTIKPGAKIKFANGTETAPSAAWNKGNWNTGFYFKKNETVTPTPTSSLLAFSDPDIQKYNASIYGVYKMEDSSAPITDEISSRDLEEVQAGTNTFSETGIKNLSVEGADDQTNTGVHYASGVTWVDNAESDGLTLSCWIYLTTDTTNSAIQIGFQDADGSNPGWDYLGFNIVPASSSSVSLTANVRNMDSPTRSGSDSTTVTSITLPGWHHILYRQDSSNAGEFFFDGVSVMNFSGDSSERAEGSIWDTNQMFVLGSVVVNNTTAANPRWGGLHKVDEIYIWRERFDDTGVSALYNGGSGQFYNL